MEFNLIYERFLIRGFWEVCGCPLVMFLRRIMGVCCYMFLIGVSAVNRPLNNVFSLTLQHPLDQSGADTGV